MTETRRIAAHGIVMSFALGIVLGAVLVPLSLALKPSYRSVALMPIALPAMLVSGTLTTTLVALGRVRARNVLYFGGPACTLVGLVILVVLLGNGVGGAVIAWLIAQGVVFAAALITTAGVWRPLELGGISLDLGQRMLLLGLRAGLVNVMSLLNYRIDLFVLKAYRGIDAVGVYSVAVSIAELLWIVPVAVATATISVAVSASEPQVVRAIAQGVRASLAVTAIAGLALAAVAPFAIPFVFGSRFDGATVPLLILIPGVVAFSPVQLLVVYFSIRAGQLRVPLGVSVASAVLTGVLAILIIPPLGLTGAALSTSIGYTISMLIGAIVFTRQADVAFTSLIPSGSDLIAYRNLLLGLLRR
jgi:O-antigen/teichoic acid export membrane protein